MLLILKKGIAICLLLPAISCISLQKRQDEPSSQTQVDIVILLTTTRFQAPLPTQDPTPAPQRTIIEPTKTIDIPFTRAQEPERTVLLPPPRVTRQAIQTTNRKIEAKVQQFTSTTQYSDVQHSSFIPIPLPNIQEEFISSSPLSSSAVIGISIACAEGVYFYKRFRAQERRTLFHQKSVSYIQRQKTLPNSVMQEHALERNVYIPPNYTGGVGGEYYETYPEYTQMRFGPGEAQFMHENEFYAQELYVQDGQENGHYTREAYAENEEYGQRNLQTGIQENGEVVWAYYPLQHNQ